MKKFQLLVVATLSLTSADLAGAASARQVYDGGGGAAVREGYHSNRPAYPRQRLECISCSGQADHKLGVCYKQHPGRADGCRRAKDTWLAKCMRACRNNR